MIKSREHERSSLLSRRMRLNVRDVRHLLVFRSTSTELSIASSRFFFFALAERAYYIRVILQNMVLEWVPVSVCIDTYRYEVHTSTYAYNARALILSRVQG